MRRVCGSLHVLPKTAALQRACDQAATREHAGGGARDVGQRHHWTATVKQRDNITNKQGRLELLFLHSLYGTQSSNI